MPNFGMFCDPCFVLNCAARRQTDGSMGTFRPMVRVLALFHKLASIKFTVFILLLIAMLVIVGTIYQARLGIYAAQQQVFGSWIFMLFGVVPLPGMLLVGVMFLVNLLAALTCRFSRHRPMLGLLLIHVGLLVLVGGGFFIAATAQESFLTLVEGESAEYSMAPSDWEIAMAARRGTNAPEWVVDVTDLRLGCESAVADSGVSITMDEHRANCRLTAAGADEKHRVESLPSAVDPAENTPGIQVRIRSGRETGSVFLFGGENGSMTLHLGDAEYVFSLRLKRWPLPLKLKLLDFKKTMHAGSEIVKSFDSLVEIETGGSRRQAVISMNRPLRFREYTFYQSAYGADDGQGESSTFSVVRSAGRWLPYAASALLFIGLAVHFMGKLIARSRRA